MKKSLLKFLFLCGLVFCSSRIIADEDIIPPKPNPPRLVNDLAGVLSAEQVAALESKLTNFSKATSNQIAVVIVNDLGNYEPSEFSFKLGRKWGIGKEDLRNGILILIKPKRGTEKGKAFIATGKGLEGAIPDATCREIVVKEMIPKFRENGYYEGIDAATTVLMALAKGEYNKEDYAKNSDDINTYIALGIAILILLLFMWRRTKRKGYTINRGGYSTPWFPFFGGGSFGGGGSDSGSDSGFGGFGGGDFGGGGAGGEW